MENLSKKCFVCSQSVTSDKFEMNTEVHMPVCDVCKGSDNERKAVAELLDSLADGLVCGCI